MLDSLLERFRQGDRLALARLLTLAARGDQVAEIAARLGPPARPARVIAVTGSGGVGKSTLIGKLLEQLRAAGKTVAVLACDPQSPLSGGALLGDRFRMPSRPDDAGVFIRSLATASGSGSVAEHLDVLVRLLEVFGFDVVLIETVGAGQGDTAVRRLADAVVLLLQPETGDDLQWEKAGLLEVADVIVIHKGDLPGAERAESQVKAMLALGPGRSVPVLRVSSSKDQGLDELVRLLDQLPREHRPQPADEQTLLRLAQERLAERWRQKADRVRPIVEQWRRGELTAAQAIDAALQLLRASSS
jgi:LAO/AO transport system ATPase